MIRSSTNLTKMQKKSKSDVKKESFYKAVFNRLREGKTPSEIAEEFGIKRQNVNYYKSNLRKWGFIGKDLQRNIIFNVKEFSLGARKPTTNLHSHQVDIPISSGKINDSNWEIKEKLRNWTPKYKIFNILGGLTIKNNNNKSISIFAHSRDIEDLEEIDQLTQDILRFAYHEFTIKQNVILDLMNAKVMKCHIATEDKDSQSMLKKGEKFTIDLDKKAEKILPKDNRDAHAWMDGSPFRFTAETDDKDWKREYLNMPFKMRETLQAVQYIAQNYASHVGVVEELHKLLRKPKVRKYIKKITNNDQTKLEDF